MGITANWTDNSQTIIRYDFEGHWDWDMFYPVYEQVITMAKSVDHRVDVVLDLRENNTFPKNVIMHIKNIADKRPKNMGKSILVTENRFALSLFRVARHLNHRIDKYFRIVPTFEEAYAIIERDRQQVTI